MASNFVGSLWAQHILDRRDAARAWFKALPEGEKKALAEAMIDYIRCFNEPEPEDVDE